MKILLFSETKEVKELLSFQVSSAFAVQVKECSTVKEAVDYLGTPDNGVEMFLCGVEGLSPAMIGALKGLARPLPTILLLDSKGSAVEKGALKGIPVLGEVPFAQLVEGVNGLLKEFIEKEGKLGDNPAEFCPIRTNLLIRATPLKSDIFIRLSKTKFIKLFKTGDEFDHRDLERYYQTKGVEYMYLRRAEIAEFIEKFRRELDSLIALPQVSQEEVLPTVEMAQETIHELVSKVGFTEEVQGLAKKNVELTLKMIGAHPRLSDLLKNVQSGGNYISQHSTLLAMVSCCVAKEMEWGSESTFSKLVLASYMHDISVPDPLIGRVNTLRELEERRSEFDEEIAKVYHLHPAKSADVVRSFKEIPADVDLIVAQHHERPNGSGFPRGLAHNYIAPLAAVFIVAHDLAQSILDQRDDFRLADFVDEKKPFYNQGNFKKVMVALEKVKI
ncbi:MAG: hypothetical protein EOP11_05120 [Proteobacteria bacterium]|nr:MAG: hypothetical protein EOP11_05120 [Pseudomonadota bacterium]